MKIVGNLKRSKSLATRISDVSLQFGNLVEREKSPSRILYFFIMLSSRNISFSRLSFKNLNKISILFCFFFSKNSFFCKTSLGLTFFAKGRIQRCFRQNVPAAQLKSFRSWGFFPGIVIVMLSGTLSISANPLKENHVEMESLVEIA